MSPNDPRLLTLARALAEVAHDGQLRKGSGDPYFTHVERVAKRAGMLGVRAAVVGYLHDVIEDTPVTRDTLFEAGFPVPILQDVVMLSREPGEPYSDFIERTILGGSDTALQVKLADLHDNLTDGWLREQSGLSARYIKADAKIRNALRQRGVEPLVF